MLTLPYKSCMQPELQSSPTTDATVHSTQPGSSSSKKARNRAKKMARLKHASSVALMNAMMLVGTTQAAETTQPTEESTSPNTQTAETKPKKASEKTDPATTNKLDEVVVTAEEVPGSYKTDSLSSEKYTQPLLNTPQTIQVVPKSVMEDQNATSLRDVLRNVPGISFQAGEGGTTPGDNIFIRGFSARNNIFIDGVRDFGMYSRDAFNLEQVEVIKGPNSSYGGRGSTGGSVNMVTKTPKLDPLYEASFGYGTNEYYRTIVDVNQPLAMVPIPGTAFRVTGLFHDQNYSALDGISDQRWGIAPSIAFGLGTDTRLIVEHFHMEQDNIPTYGIPNPSIIGGGYSLPEELWHNFYGLVGRDYERITTDNFRGKFEHDFTEDISLRNQTTWGETYRDSIITAPRRATGSPIVGAGAIIGRQDWKSRDQTDSVVANQTSLNTKFDTFAFKHNLVTSVEYSHEDEISFTRASTAPAAVAALPTTSLLGPNPYDPYGFTFFRTGAYNKSYTDTLAWSLFDAIEITDQWEINGGVRVDNAETVYESVTAAGVTTELTQTDLLPSWRIGLVYKPLPNGSIYFNYANSFDPSAENLTLAASTVRLDPEESDSYELGTKWEFFKKNLMITAALFRTEKTNARVTDPVDATLMILSGEQVAQGVEFSFSGNLTKDWKVYGGYAYVNSEIVSSTTANQIGKQMVQSPEQTANIWTTYTLPFKLEIGTGAQYMDKVYNDAANTLAAEGYWLQSAMVSYPINDHWDVQLNIQNLWDTRYIDRLTGGQAIPGPGRSFVVTTTVKF